MLEAFDALGEPSNDQNDSVNETVNVKPVNLKKLRSTVRKIQVWIH